MTGLTFAMLDRRKEKNKQTDKQNLAGYFYKKPDASPEQYLMFKNEHHGLVLKCQI